MSLSQPIGLRVAPLLMAAAATAGPFVAANGVVLEAEQQVIDVNNLPRTQLRDALLTHVGLKGMRACVRERIEAQAPFDSAAEMQSRINRLASRLEERLSSKYLPIFFVSAPLCEPRGNTSSSGQLLGGALFVCGGPSAMRQT